MSLYDRQQVRRLRERVRLLLSLAPELERFVPNKRARSAFFQFCLLRGFVALAFTGWMTQLRLIAGEPAAQGALLAWCLNSVFWRANSLQTGLVADPSWRVLNLLPTSDHATLRWFLRRHWLDATRLAMDCTLLYLVWFVPMFPTWQTVIGCVLFGILHGLGATLTAQLIVARFYDFPSFRAGCVSTIACVTFWFSGQSGHLAQAASGTGSVLKWVTPGGWIDDVFRAGWIGGEATAWLGLIPLTLLAFLLPWSLGELLPFHAARPIEMDKPGAFPESQQTASAAMAPVPSAIGPTAKVELVRARTFLPEFTWNREGQLEQVISRLFTARDRHIAIFLDERMPQPTKSLISAAKAFAVVALFSLITSQFTPALTAFVLFVGAAYMLQALPLPGVSGVLMATQDAGAVNKPHTLFPLTPRELMRLGWKISLVRLVAGLPLLIGFGAWTAWLMHWPVRDGAWIGGKLGLICFTLHPLAFTISCEGGSLSKRRVGVWIIVPLLMLAVLVLIVVVIVFPFLPNKPNPASLSLPLFTIVLSRVIFELYYLGWKRCWYDSDRVK